MQHPAVDKQVAMLFDDLVSFLRDVPTMRLGLVEGALMLDDLLFTEDVPAVNEIIGLLNTLELEGIECITGLAKAELQTAISILSKKTIKGEFLEREFIEQDVRHVRMILLQHEEEEETPRQVYGRAIKVVDDIFHDVRLGKIPSSTEALSVVKSMAQITLSDPHALFALSMLKDYDNYTFTHSVNVAVIALAVGRACGLSEEELRILGFGALLHDLGKLKIDIGIITKPGRLSDEEFEEIKKHPSWGADIVKQMEGVTPEVIDIVLGHHLRFNRTGYPETAVNRKMSAMTDMTAIADTYDAITTLRSYQRPLTPRMAVDLLRKLKETSLHPDYTEKFITSLGPYPVGSLVRLDTNEIGLVVWVDTLKPDYVRLKVLFDPDGNSTTPPYEIELSEIEAKRIVKEVDPLSKGIEPASYFDIK